MVIIFFCKFLIQNPGKYHIFTYCKRILQNTLERHQWFHTITSSAKPGKKNDKSSQNEDIFFCKFLIQNPGKYHIFTYCKRILQNTLERHQWFHTITSSAKPGQKNDKSSQNEDIFFCKFLIQNPGKYHIFTYCKRILQNTLERHQWFYTITSSAKPGQKNDKSSQNEDILHWKLVCSGIAKGLGNRLVKVVRAATHLIRAETCRNLQNRQIKRVLTKVNLYSIRHTASYVLVR